MTKETKIGLLVGLAFIILFAIILSEKGTESRDTSPPTFAVADAAKDTSSLRSDERPLQGDGRLPIRERLAERVTPKPADTADDDSGELRPAPLGKPIPAEDEDLPPLPESFVAMINESLDDKPVEPAVEAQNDEPTISIEEAVAGAITQDDSADLAPAASDPEPPVPIVTRSTQAHTHKLAQANEAARAAEIAAAPAVAANTDDAQTDTRTSPAPKMPIVTLAKHVVQPGESLGKIAAKYYGRSTPQRIEAIYHANRDVIDNINTVKVNDELRIPRLDGGTPSSFEPAPGFIGAQVAQAQQPINRPTQVRIPLPVGDQTRPEGTQRDRTAERRAVSPAEQPVRTVNDRDTTPAFTWYEVRERDTLSRIAQRLLGNERRYLEIYKLNKDRLPDMNALKPGQKIRIPVRSSHAESGDEVRSASVISLDRL